jgi:hypothetical protein
MLGNSKWAPGGANYETEPEAPAPPANAPTGPRDAQPRGRRSGPRRGGLERGKSGGRGERNNNQDGNNGGAAGYAPYRSPSVNDDRSRLAGVGFNSANANAVGFPSGEDVNSPRGRTTPHGLQGSTGYPPFQSLPYQPSHIAPRHRGFQPGTSQAPFDIGVGRSAEQGTSTISLPNRSLPSLSSAKDVLHHAAQDRDGSTVETRPQVAAEKTEEQKAPDVEPSIPTVSQGVSPSVGTDFKVKRTETQATKPTSTDLNTTTTHTYITGTSTNTDMEARIKALEDQQNDTGDTVDALQQLYTSLKDAIEDLKRQNTQQQVRPQVSRPPTADLQTHTGDGNVYIPTQGNLSDLEYGSLMERFAGSKVSAQDGEEYVLGSRSFSTTISATDSEGLLTVGGYAVGQEDEEEDDDVSDDVFYDAEKHTRG